MEKYITTNHNFVCSEDEDTILKSWTPHVLIESTRGFDCVNLMTKQLTDRKIFLIGEVDNVMANQFVSELLYLSKNDEPIDIYINSLGGSVTSGLVIYDTIQSLDGKVPINMYCMGSASSMAAVILAGGQKGRRYILPHSKCMIHEPLIPGGMGGSATSIKKTADSILETKAITNGILAKHTGKTLEEIDAATSFDNFMNAEEAIAFGLVDEIRNIL